MATDDQRTQERVDRCVGVLRDAGVKLTHQRLEICAELARGPGHPDAETVYAAVRQRIPTISLDTVYRTLRLLEAEGAIQRAGHVGGSTRFDTNTEPHHHFICSRCGRMVDVHSERLGALEPPPHLGEVGSVDAVRVEFIGVCRACAQGESDGPQQARGSSCQRT